MNIKRNHIFGLILKKSYLDFFKEKMLYKKCELSLVWTKFNKYSIYDLSLNALNFRFHLMDFATWKQVCVLVRFLVFLFMYVDENHIWQEYLSSSGTEKDKMDSYLPYKYEMNASPIMKFSTIACNKTLHRCKKTKIKLENKNESYPPISKYIQPNYK